MAQKKILKKTRFYRTKSLISTISFFV